MILMTVNPGFGGQAFMPEVLPKIREAREIILRQNYNIDITVDGGIGDETAPGCVSAGANVLVAGTSLFKQGDLKQAVSKLRTSAGSGRASG